MGKFIITEEEKSRILGMHKSAISKEFLMEGEKEDTSLSNIFNQVAAEFNNAIKANPKLDQTQLTVSVIPGQGDNGNTYKWIYGGQQIPEDENLTINTKLLITNGPEQTGNLIFQTFNPSINKKLPKVFYYLGQGGLKKAVNTWVAGQKGQVQKPGTPK